MRSALLVLAGVFALVAATSAPVYASGPERRHASGILLLPPVDLAQITRLGPMYEPLAKA